MGHTLEKLEGNKIKLTFEIPAADFETAVQKAYLANRGGISIPGFRKGKAPRKLIESMYGAEVFYDDALEKLFATVYPDAVTEEKLITVGRPDVKVEDIEKGKDVVFTCEVYVYPEVTLGQYEGVEVERKLHKVTDEKVKHEIEHERKRVARSVEVTDRALQDGDTAELDYSGSVDGERFEGGTAEHQTLVIGSGSFIPGFEEQMVGMSVGEERDINVKFPDEYHAENLKGKDAVFHVKLHGITREELPELDDDFASEVSDFDTYAEYEASLREKLQSAEDDRATLEAKEQLIDTIVKNATLDVPPPMVEDKLDEMLDNMAQRMQRQGFTMEQYIQMLGGDVSKLRDMYRDEALNNVKAELVIDALVKERGVEADDAEVDKLLERMLEGMNQSVEAFKGSLNEAQIEYFRNRARIDKLLDELWSKAKIADVEVDDAADKNGDDGKGSKSGKSSKGGKSAKSSKSDKDSKSDKSAKSVKNDKNDKDSKSDKDGKGDEN